MSYAVWLLAYAVHLLRHRGDSLGAFQRAYAWAKQHAPEEVHEWLREAAEARRTAYGPKQGWIKWAFIHAFRHMLQRTPYEDAIRETICGGGDTDTNACIVGAMLGALHGARAIPEYMLQPVRRVTQPGGRGFLAACRCGWLGADGSDTTPLAGRCCTARHATTGHRICIRNTRRSWCAACWPAPPPASVSTTSRCGGPVRTRVRGDTLLV